LTAVTEDPVPPTPPARAAWRPPLAAAFGVTPFFVFAVLFLILPMLFLVVGAFQDRDGHATLGNIASIFASRVILDAYWISIKVSFVSALAGAILGFLIAHAIILGGLPSWIRPAVLTFSGVASQFAGVPLAFAFLATLGRTGLVTWLMKTYLGLDLYAGGFNILSFAGLTVTYLYFQIPLMVLIIAPAIDGLKREWGEAAATLGASRRQYWLMVALPILWPSLMGCALLLFANAFGAIATAYALTGSSLNIITIVLYAQIRGDVLHDQNLGYALALGMIVITGLSNTLYIVLRGRAERWIR
jgi:putative spermidine/putrescine transport system permease protein